MGKILAFRPGHSKWDQNSQFLPLSETTSIPVSFMWGSPPPRGRCKTNGLLVSNSPKKCLDIFSYITFYTENVLDWTQEKLILLFLILWFKTWLCIVFRLVLAMPWSVCSNNIRFDGKRATRRKRRPQGTHGEAYPCITWCSWLFISSD